LTSVARAALSGSPFTRQLLLHDLFTEKRTNFASTKWIYSIS